MQDITTKDFFPKLDIIEINNSRKVWKTIKPFFLIKIQNRNNILLSESHEMISETNIAYIRSKYFVSVTKK